MRLKNYSGNPNTSRIVIKPKKSLGQNFLIDENIARKIVESLILSENDVVVEIGPGQGALTKYIVENVKKIYAVEIDKRAAEELQSNISSNKLIIINQDFLEFDLGALDTGSKMLKLVGNIPYHLTSEILFRAIDHHKIIENVTMMIQKEVADRLTAKPNTKAYGILSVLAQFYGVPKNLFKVSPNCFYPKPKVTSSVVRIDFHHKLPFENVDAKLFRVVVRTTFGKRRKTLRNCLKYLPFDEMNVKNIIKEINFPLNKRPEELSINEFVILTNKIDEIMKCPIV